MKDDKPKVYPNAGRVGRTGTVGRPAKPAPAPAPAPTARPGWNESFDSMLKGGTRSTPRADLSSVRPGSTARKTDPLARVAAGVAPSPKATAPRPAPKPALKAAPRPAASRKAGGSSDMKAWAAKEQAALRSTKPKAPAAAPKRSGNRGYDSYKKLMD